MFHVLSIVYTCDNVKINHETYLAMQPICLDTNYFAICIELLPVFFCLHYTLWQSYSTLASFLNQAHTGHRPACAWFLKIDPVWIVYMRVYVCVCVCVCVCMCPPLRLLITSGMMWHNMDPKHWLNKFYNCYMDSVVIIINMHGLGIDTCRKH